MIYKENKQLLLRFLSKKLLSIKLWLKLLSCLKKYGAFFVY